MPRDMVQVRRGQTQQYRGPDAKIGRSQFNRSHGLKTTFNASYLIPILVDEVLPGDTFTMKLHGFCRIFSPLDAPVMDNVELETSFWYCPARILWDNWEYFMGAHDAAGAQDTTYTIPNIQDGATSNADPSGGTGIGSLLAYMGIPDDATTTANDINSLPFRMYNKVYDEWFRDQNLTAMITHETGNGPDAYANLNLLKTNKKHEYFTSCLPYLQKGTAQTVALTGTALVATPATSGTDVSVEYGSGTGTAKLDAGGTFVDVSATGGTEATMALYADLDTPWSLGTSATLDVNALRQSIAIQRLLEKDARGGTRYVEIIKSHFGVTSPDFRLQRPEYLGGGQSPYRGVASGKY